MSTVKNTARLRNRRRYGDPWVSKNRHLNPNKSKRMGQIYRNPNFDTDETKLLIQLWGDPKVQRELITTHKKHLVILQLAHKMEEYGYCRSPEEITTRIKNMKCFYNRLKKEMESNPNLDPSWRHYNEMDAIMTRPIFSVRPNEVPAPSLKYLMEQREEMRKDRKRQAEEEGILLSDSDDDINDVIAVPNTNRSDSYEDECIIPDADIEFECDDITLAAIANSANTNTIDKFDNTNKNNTENNNNKNDSIQIKTEIESEKYHEVDLDKKEQIQIIPSPQRSTDDDMELLIPKEEPIDVDNPMANNKVPKKPEPSPIITAPNLMEILSQPKISTAMATPIAITNFSMAQGTCMTNTSSAANSNCSSSSSTQIGMANSLQSKISLVSPTVLMPQTNQQIAPAATATQSSLPMNIGANIQAFLTSPGPNGMTGKNSMKFILVNTGDQRLQTTMAAPTLTMATTTPSTPSMGSSSIPKNQFLRTQSKGQKELKSDSPSKSSNGLGSPKKPAAPSMSEIVESWRRKELSGIKSTLIRLLKAREVGNDLQSQRLSIERQRLQHERTVAEKYIEIFEQNQKFQQQLLQQQQLILQNQQQQYYLQAQLQRPISAQTQQLFAATTAKGTPAATMQNASGQMMMPPKLLITTMVPTSAANASGAINTTIASKVLTAPNFSSLTNNFSVNNVVGGGITDTSLLIPKEEPNT